MGGVNPTSGNVRKSRMKFDLILLLGREKEENMAEMIKRFFVIGC